MAIILGVLGEKLGGKGLVGEYITEKYGGFHIRYSNILDDLLDILDLPVSRDNEINLGMALRQAFGQWGILNKAVKKRLMASHAPIKVIDGIRFEEELIHAREMGAKIVYVTAPQEVRLSRFKLRQEKKDDGNTEEYFLGQEPGQPPLRPT